MAFDLGSAKPVEAPQSGGFDLGSARPVAPMVPERKLGAYEPPPRPPYREGESMGLNPKGLAEPLMAMGTGLAAAPTSWLAGLGAIPLHKMGAIQTQPSDVQANVQRTMTYQPETTIGKGLTSAISYPFEKLGEGAQWVGRKVTGGLGGDENTAASDPAGMAGNATAETLMQLLQFLPLIKGAPKGPVPPGPRDIEAARLGAGREKQMRELPVPITDSTVGQVMRDPVQLRRESQVSQTDSGAPIRDVYVEQNRQLLENLETLKGRTGARAKSETEVGRRVAGEEQAGRPGAEGALTRQAAEANKEVSRLYREAEKAGDTQGKVEIKPLLNYLAKHEDPTQVAYAVSKLKALKLIREDEFGNIVPMKAEGPLSGVLTINELEGVRRAATAAQKDGGTKGHYAAELKREIDALTEGAGGDAYKAARKARKDYADRFEEPRSVDQLLAEKSRTDRATALEDVWSKTVLQGSIADLQRARDTLLSGNNRRTTDSGRKAWRDIAGQTVEHIKEAATKSVAMDEAGRPNLSADALNKALDKIGDDKLRLILGDTATKQLRALSDVAADLKTKPPSRIAGSDTNVNLLTRVEGILDHLPILGGTGKAILRLGNKAYEASKGDRFAREALARPGAGKPPKPPMSPGGRGLTLDAMQWMNPPSGPPPQ